MRLCLSHQQSVRNLMVTEHQTCVLNEVWRKSIAGMNSSELAEIMGISIFSSSVVLTKLFRKGYLTRSEYVQPSGGIQYKYHFNEEIYK